MDHILVIASGSVEKNETLGFKTSSSSFTSTLNQYFSSIIVFFPLLLVNFTKQIHRYIHQFIFQSHRYFFHCYWYMLPSIFLILNLVYFTLIVERTRTLPHFFYPLKNCIFKAQEHRGSLRTSFPMSSLNRELILFVDM